MRGAELINLYGPTETTIQVTAEKVQAGEDQVPVGRIIDNVRIYVLDPHGNPCAVGVRGEIHIGGASLAKGYVNQPDLTAERFVPDPFTAAPSARMYCSGDIGAWRADGRLDFFGRADGQVKLRGFRIEFGEIESVAHALPGVINVAVAVTRDPDSEIDQLICCYTQNEAAPVDPQALKQHLARSLPEYMVPNWCVAVEAMPLTPSGKIDRKAVAQTKINVPGAANQQPRDPTELRLESVWENVLNVHPVGIDNNFFDLGGHSLLAVRLVAEVKREFGHDLPLASLFSAPTVALQAELLRQASVQADPVLAPIRNGSNDGCPVFFVHPTGGSVLCYRELARGLGDHPVYGLQDPGLESIAEYDSVEELAALYIKKIAPVVGDKPWCIAGWSSGGVIAYEMANQILAAGKPLGMVAMLDSQAVTGPGSSTDDLRLVRAITRLVSYQSGIEALEKDQVSLDNALDQLLDLARRTGVLPQSAGREQVDRLFNVFRRNVDVIGRYRAPAFHRRVLLFKATRPMHESVRNAAIHTQSDLPSFGWENLCNVVTHHVGADHLSIVSEPAAASVASQLLNEICEADRIHTLDNQVMFMMLGV
jgi:thioesterase domain-containing protein/acyl carrier protein